MELHGEAPKKGEGEGKRLMEYCTSLGVFENRLATAKVQVISVTGP